MMDGLVSRDTELVVDFESGGTTSEEDGIVLAKNQGGEVVNTFSSFHCLPNSSKFADENVELLLDKREECQHHVVWVKKELAKEKKNESRKHPSHLGRLKVHHDHKLVHEIAELAMRKRTRAERIRMLKKMRAAKSSSWNGNLLVAEICVRSKGMSLQGSPQPAIVAKEDMIAIEFFSNSDRKSDAPASNSPNSAEGQVSGLSKR